MGFVVVFQEKLSKACRLNSNFEVDFHQKVRCGYMLSSAVEVLHRGRVFGWACFHEEMGLLILEVTIGDRSDCWGTP